MGEVAGQSVATLDGRQFKPLVLAALSWLRQHQAAINALNVFPVPDGDTGTNMMLTMTSAWDEVADLDEEHIGQLLGKVAHGALMGARGNSGVILSQIWRGLARGIDGKSRVSTEDIAMAMRVASETAYKGVVKPVEGTILTVVREVAEEADVIAGHTTDMVQFFEHLVRRARRSVDHTPALLPVLRQAGVVDSGGQGLFVILDGMYRSLKGLPVAEAPQRVPSTTEIQPHLEAELEFDADYPYDVQLIIVGHHMDLPKIRADIEAMGDCPLTVGDADTIKVHVHVADPGIPISYAARHGSVRDVVVEDMRVQFEAFSEARQADVSTAPVVPLVIPDEEPPAIGVVVVAAGDGLARVFKSLGATTVVEGGQTMNPSTAQILEAVESSPSSKVIILPNNKNIFMAAQQAAQVSHKEVTVVPTRSIPQGIAALLAFDPLDELEHNAETMLESAKYVITGEVTQATRNVQLNGIDVNEGDAIGILDEQLVVDSSSYEEAVHWLLAEADLEDRELVTLYYGEGVDAEQADALAERLAESYPDLEIEVVAGGQPHYPYLISIE